ncbi:zinc finger protein 771-like [Pollicipes pollicipes]|uniref:zinc finger protein 771-like n=1 Tax=Pollicipes pollicipes TaxID=41117 RepID=UPI001884C8F4|nr:zinc finger protein 771-like [Pollicipes pollicipes]
MHDASLQRHRCPHCPRSFAWQQTRDRHVSREHTGEERVACPQCGALFLPGSLRGHQQRVHMKLRNFSCGVCNKTFHRKSEVDGHMRSHTQERPFVCAACGQQFGHLTHLRRHEDKHRRAAEDRTSDERVAAEDARPRRTYQGRRARPDIVHDSLLSACIPLREDEMTLVPLAAPPAGHYVTLIGPERTEYLLVDMVKADEPPSTAGLE